MNLLFLNSPVCGVAVALRRACGDYGRLSCAIRHIVIRGAYGPNNRVEVDHMPRNTRSCLPDPRTDRYADHPVRIAAIMLAALPLLRRSEKGVGDRWQFCWVVG